MKHIQKKKVKVIHRQNAIEFEEAMNEFLDIQPEAEIDRDNTIPFLAYLYYLQDIQIPETIADEYILQGYDHRCKDCPHCVLEGKRWNQKRVPCEFTATGHTFTDAPVCDLFYMEGYHNA